MITKTNAKVRLSSLEISAIRDVVSEISSHMDIEWKTISLFGSRIDLDAKGGDIDLYIEIRFQKENDLYLFKQHLRRRLFDQIGGQKIDLIIDDRSKDLGAISEIIFKSKVDLWKQD